MHLLEHDKKDATRAFEALASIHYVTPKEGYGFNLSWAISDLIRAVKERTERAEKSEARVKVLEESIAELTGCEVDEERISVITPAVTK